MHKWEIGQKVRILDASKIESAEFGEYITGGIYKVADVDVFDNTPILEPNKNFQYGLCFFESEKQYYEFVE